MQDIRLCVKKIILGFLSLLINNLAVELDMAFNAPTIYGEYYQYFKK